MNSIAIMIIITLIIFSKALGLNKSNTTNINVIVDVIILISDMIYLF